MIVKIIQKIEVLTNAVLITGASGLIGTRLTEVLLQKGCRVSHLGRSPHPGLVPCFRWDPEDGYLDEAALDGPDTIVHLAGSGIAEKRWSEARKLEILNSRVKAAALLADALKRRPHTIKTIVAASAIGYYGDVRPEKVLKEEDAPGTDFLSSVVVRWEEETKKLQLPGIRLVTIRIGIVLSDKGGALREMMAPIRRGVGAPLGTGKQIMSWIHIDDLCELVTWAVNNSSTTGTFNGVAPHPVTNRVFTYELARVVNRRIWLPAVPAFALRLVLGEMADLVLNGAFVSSAKAVKQGFRFRYETLPDALNGLPLL